MMELVLGGARSGKSAFAEQRLIAEPQALVYIATAAAGDREMSERIAHHRARRDDRWQTVEEPIALAATIGRATTEGRAVLVDCLTLWLTNLLLAERPDVMQWELQALLDLVERRPGRVLLVSNEVGQGIVPMDALSRRFVDESGRLHQQLAQRCDRVWWVIAGLPQLLKGTQ